MVGDVLTTRKTFASALIIVALFGAGCTKGFEAERDSADAFQVEFELVAAGLTNPVAIAVDRSENRSLFVVEKRGIVQVIHDGIFQETPAMNIEEEVETVSWEQGLLDLEFHPTEPRVFARFTPPQLDPNTTTWSQRVAVVEYAYDPTATPMIDTTNGTTLIEVQKPSRRHNAGSLVFGPDGYLYAGIGDGEWSLEARNQSNLLGTIIRIDVETPGSYQIPSDNPFAQTPGYRPEIWQYGIRNPWKMAFDRETGDLWLADVGGALREEVNRIPLGEGGHDYGWGDIEGDFVRKEGGVNHSLYKHPVFAYPNGEEDAYGLNRCAIVGGVLYRGDAIPQLRGRYVFGDLCAGAVYALERQDNGTWQETLLLPEYVGISAIEEDRDGELLVINWLNGTIRRIVPAVHRGGTN